MRTLSTMSSVAVLALVVASGCGGNGDPSSGTASAGSGSGATSGAGSAGGSGTSSGASGSGGASASGSTSTAASSGASTGASGSTSTSTSAASSGSGGGGGLGAACTWPQACAAGLYCAAPGCGAGTCAKKPGIALVSNVADLVCGCDHVTYWNADTAAYHGASTVVAKGACPGGMAISCDAATPCPQGYACNHHVPAQAQCAAPGAGTCWSMPISCPVGGAKAKACSNAACATVCDLIQSQNPWWDDGLCP